MPRIFASLLAGVLTVAAATATAQQPAAAPAATVAERIEAHLAQPRFAGASWGIKAVSLDTGRVLHEHDPDRRLVPASTAKLYTGALALATLGPDHRIATTLLATAKPTRDGNLRGDLILFGYGDPTLGTPAHARWAEELADAAAKAGIRKVEGDLIADATQFAAPSHGGGWEAADLQSWFAVPATALSVNENVVRLFVAPGDRAGDAARLRFEPPVLGQAFDVDNTMRTVAPPQRSDISLVRRPGEHRLTAFGRVALRAKEVDYRLSLPDPPLLAGHLLRRALGERGIAVTGKLRSIAWPRVDEARQGERVWQVGETWSPPLSAILERGFKLSQNLYMQNLLLLVGVHEELRVREAAEGKPEPPFRTTEQHALAAMRRYLGSLGIGPDEAQLDDGAGLSRRNLTTAAAFVKLLVAHADDPAKLAFRSALPESGVDGTLAGRLRDPSARGRVFAKTGAMRNTASLAGYATTTTGERIAFALILNNYVRPPSGGRTSAELDEIVRILLDAPRSAPADRAAAGATAGPQP